MAHERGIVFEVCPTSNVQSCVVRDFQHHPLRDMLFFNLVATLNTDNTCVSNVTLSEEMDNVIEGLGLSLTHIKAMALNAARAAFLPDAERRVLVNELSAALDEFPDAI
jgi:adenosine deaminase